MSTDQASTSLATPRENGGLLLHPSPTEALRAARADGPRLNESAAVVAGAALSELRVAARSDLAAAQAEWARACGLPVDDSFDPATPLVVTGHQCQFFHCGILVKYVLADWLAARMGGVVWNLAVDSDLPKHTALRLPVATAAGPAVRALPLATHLPGEPMSQQPAPSPEDVARLRDEIGRAKLAAEVRPRAQMVLAELDRAARRGRNLAETFVLLNRALAAELDLHWADVPVSALVKTSAFARFAYDLLRHAEKVRTAYNAALGEYRRRNRLRGRAQPVPDLSGNDRYGGGEETPLWIVGWGRPRRTAFVRRQNGQLVLGDGAEVLARVPDGEVNDDKAAELRAALRDADISLQPKALMLTTFARLWLADTFVHGIGGARYDEVTDAFIAAYYGLRPPSYVCASATMYLAAETSPTPTAVAEQRRAVERRQRDLRFNPDRYLDAADRQRHEVRALMEARQQAIAESNRLAREQGLPEQRRAAFERIHKLNEQLTARADLQRRTLEARRRELEQLQNAAAAAHDRELFFGLFEPSTLRAALCIPPDNHHPEETNC